MDRLRGRDTVEGQGPSRTVHKHCYSVRHRRKEGPGVTVAETGTLAILRAAQTPGLISTSKPAAQTAPPPDDPPVAHCNTNVSLPLNLPVTETSQPVGAQNLVPVVKPLRMRRALPFVSGVCHLPVVVGKFEVFVSRV